MTASTDIRFRDLVRREEQALEALRHEQVRLEQIKRRSADEVKDLARIEKLLARQSEAHKLERFDPLYVAVRVYLNENAGFIGDKVLLNHEDGRLQVKKGPLAFAEVAKIALILGYLAVDDVPLPRLVHVKTDPAGDPEIVVDKTHPSAAVFTKHFFAALGEAQGALELAKLVLPYLEHEGDSDVDDKHPGEVETAEFAQVMRCLQARGVSTRELQLKRRIDQCLDQIQRVGVEKPLIDTPIALPNLDRVTNSKIPPENIRQVGVWICVAMFRELKVYQVVEQILADAQDGSIVLGASKVNDMLYQYWKDAPNRLQDAEREGFLSKILGLPGGDPRLHPGNEQFSAELTRGCATVSSLVRKAEADKMLRSNLPLAINQQAARKALRDLALNLSSHAFGLSHLVAREEQATINFIIELLSDKDLLAAYGAPDMRGLIDQIATLELGGPRNTARYLSMATCGAIITAWLADNIEKINNPTSRTIIDVYDVLSSDPQTAGDLATVHPKDYDFVNACELWLLDTAQSEESIESLASRPRLSPDVSSRPIQIPSIARDMLQQVGVPGLGHGVGLQR